MKQLFFTCCIIATIISCNNNKKGEQTTIIAEKFGDSSNAKLPESTFEQQLVAKSQLPDTLAMSAYRTTGCFEGISNFKDSIYVNIDVEAKKVTGSLIKINAGKKASENIFEGKLVNNIITPTRGVPNSVTFTISGNELIYKFEKDSVVLTWHSCK